MQETKVFIGPVIHSEKREQVTIIKNAAIVVKNNKIEAVEDVADQSLASLKARFAPADIITLGEGQFLIPGLIDTHIHAPQFPNTGLGYDKPLLDWLSTYTFPLESQYEDADFSRAVYQAVVNRTLNCGTTTAVYFGSVHQKSCEVLAETIVSAGQRALVGKVNMDRYCVPAMVEETATSLRDTEAFVEYVNALKSSLVRPVVTPRFAITCTPFLLKQLAKLALKYDLHIQTHLSENNEEVKEVKRLFPEAANYADVYHQANLLNNKTILAHCVYLGDEEVELLRRRGCTVAHCPNSNICLQSGLCNVRRLLTAGVNVSLGTDIAGGCSPSILDAMRSCMTTSVSLSFTQPDSRPLLYHEVFYMATMGGAIALNMADKLGNFTVGKYFDAIVVDTKQTDSLVDVLGELSLAELFQKFIYTGDDRNIHKVYVNGNLVKKKC